MSLSLQKNSADTTDESSDNYLPNLEELAVVITFRQTIEQFFDDAPTKLKWCNLTASDVRRFMYYNIIEEAENTMGTQTVWQLQGWVEAFLHNFDTTFNFSVKQIKEITRYSDTLLQLPEEFTGKNSNLAGRSLGHLHNMNVLTMKEDNRHAHKPTVWTVSEKTERLLRIRAHYQDE